jgi:hypothetical protein
MGFITIHFFLLLTIVFFILFFGSWPFFTHSQLLEGLKFESQTENNGGQGVGACSLVHNIIEGQRGVLEFWDGTRKK